MSTPAAGFTLLEIMVVLVIGAAMYALVLGVPFRGASIADLKASARQLASGLRQAQTLAMVTRRDALLTVDVQERQYFLAGDTEPKSLPRDIEVKLFTAQSEIVNDNRGAIRFYPDGSSTGGRITVKSGERQYLVDVDWLTGRVSIND
ncbi:MAG TPA: GspH/FimT family pseudopilin [Usitatibacter sp.]|nr:GspH/FimT family pseudopilin [Usitatibacter sp.]